MQIVTVFATVTIRDFKIMVQTSKSAARTLSHSPSDVVLKEKLL